MKTWAVQITFETNVAAENAHEAIDAAYEKYKTGQIAKEITEGTMEPFDMSWKDAQPVEEMP